MREPARLDGSQVCPAPLHDEHLHVAIEDVRLPRLHRRVSASRLHQRQVTANQVRQIDELLDVALASVSVAPNVVHRLFVTLRNEGCVPALRLELTTLSGTRGSCRSAAVQWLTTILHRQILRSSE